MINLNTSTATSGTGIDVTSAVDQILYAERAPERLWQQQQSKLTTEATALNGLKASLSSLSDKVYALKDILGVMTSKIASSSQESILTASAQASATTGSHVIVVSNLASTSSYYSDPVGASDLISNGTFDVTVGTGAPHTVTVNASNNTVAGLAQSINALQIGVRASVINDASGIRLALVSNTAGEPGDVVISGNTTGLSLTKASSGRNAAFTMDGVPLTSASNTVTGALEGVTLQLATAAPTTEVTVTIGADAEGATQAIQAFVDAFNSIISSVNAQFALGASGSAGPLSSSSSVRTLQSRLLSAVTYSIKGNNGFVNLSSLGVKMNNDGTLTVDAAELKDATVNHFADVQNFFQNATTGFAINFSHDLSVVNDSTKGLLSTNLTENSTSQRVLSKQIEDFEDRLVARKKFLIDEYSRIDAMLRQLPLLQAQISSQLDAFSKG